MMHNNPIEKAWREFLESTGRDMNTPCYEAFSFSDHESAANYLADLVMKGLKTATTSVFRAYEIEQSNPPQPKDLSLVTDWQKTPLCVIETTQVQILPFHAMTFEICRREGEDTCLETWKATHLSEFTREGKEIGYEFTEDSLLVFEDFIVVYRFNPSTMQSEDDSHELL